MTKKIILLSFVLFLSFSCSNKSTETQDRVDPDTLLMMRSMNERNEPLDTLKKRVLENGDVEAYDELMIGLLDYNIELRIKWSKIMANKHDYVRAYRDYVGEMSMKCSPDPPFSCLTKNEKDTVSLFLNRAIEKGDSSAIELKKEYNLK